MKKGIQAVVEFPQKILEPLKNYLMNEEKRLKKTRARLEKEDPYSNSWSNNNDDDAAIDSEVMEMASHDQVLAEKKETKRALINIRKTLTRIKIGKYGLCEECNKMIDTDRLAINPTALYCVECERKRESSKKK